MKLTNIRTEEILHFLGYGTADAEDDVLAVIEEMKTKVLSLSVPRVIYREFPLLDENPIGINILSGSDIQRLLKECHHCIFMAATLGTEIEKEGKRLQIMDMGKAVIFDSCASAAIEQVCDTFQMETALKYQAENMYLTDRFSCGYGDLPLTIQKDFLRLLDAQRKIGLHVSESCTLVPRKSVTAIIGLADRIQPAILRGCAYCLLNKHCEYRKGGSVCGRK